MLKTLFGRKGQKNRYRTAMDSGVRVSGFHELDMLADDVLRSAQQLKDAVDTLRREDLDAERRTGEQPDVPRRRSTDARRAPRGSGAAGHASG